MTLIPTPISLELARERQRDLRAQRRHHIRKPSRRECALANRPNPPEAS
jgi:hypothetical protein